MSVTLTRRGFMMGAGAVALLPPTRLSAQTAASMGVAVDGTLIFTGPNTSAAQRAALGRVATGIARAAPSRAMATATFRAAASRFLAGAAVRTPMGMAALAGVGGAYYLFTGKNALDGLLDLTKAYAPLEFRYPADCAGMPKRSSGAANDWGYALGVFNDVADTSTYCTPKIRYKTFHATKNPPPPAVPAGWTQDRAAAKFNDKQELEGYTIWYSKNLLGSGGMYNLPADADLAATLTTAQKAKVISEGALGAIAAGIWKDYQGWADGGFTGGGGGSFGGGGATGTWGDEVAGNIMGNKPVKGGVTGGIAKPDRPTMGDVATPFQPSSPTPDWTYPSRPMFPDDAGYNGTAPDPQPIDTDGGNGGVPGTTEPTPTETSTPSQPYTCPPGNSDCPAVIDWGAPPSAETDGGVGSVSPMDWFPSPFQAPQINATCSGWEATIAHMGRVSINPCPQLDSALPVIRPVVIVAGTVMAGRTLLDM